MRLEGAVSRFTLWSVVPVIWGLWATVVVTRSSIFEPLRALISKKTSVLECALCTGFWVGSVVAIVTGLPLGSATVPIVSLGSYLLATWLDSKEY